jgi:hypothetical protein
MPARVRARVTEVASHSDSIIDQLNSILEAAGVTTPVPACSYKFITPDLDSFLTAAQTLQSIAISAYLGKRCKTKMQIIVHVVSELSRPGYEFSLNLLINVHRHRERSDGSRDFDGLRRFPHDKSQA